MPKMNDKQDGIGSLFIHESNINFLLSQENSEIFDVTFEPSILYNITLKEFQCTWIFIINNKGMLKKK